MLLTSAFLFSCPWHVSELGVLTKKETQTCTCFLRVSLIFFFLREVERNEKLILTHIPFFSACSPKSSRLSSLVPSTNSLENHEGTSMRPLACRCACSGRESESVVWECRGGISPFFPLPSLSLSLSLLQFASSEVSQLLKKKRPRLSFHTPIHPFNTRRASARRWDPRA